jgi:hypothetical protein
MLQCYVLFISVKRVSVLNLTYPCAQLPIS